LQNIEAAEDSCSYISLRAIFTVGNLFQGQAVKVFISPYDPLDELLKLGGR
jgi:hypothetical protein